MTLFQPSLAGRPRILLVKLSSFGDVLHALPTLEAMRGAYPEAQITWLVEAAYAPLLAGHPALDEVLLAPRLHLGQILAGDNPALFRRLITHLQNQHFDLVLDLQGLAKSALWVSLAKSPRKVGYDRTREGSYLVLTERLAPYDKEAHAVQRYLNLAHSLGATPAPPRFRLELGRHESISHLLGKTDNRPLAVLHPGARWASKLWPAANWAALGRWLARQGFRTAVTGSAVDKPLTAAVAAGINGAALDLGGRTSLAELAAVLRQARLAVTPDTGTMHLAAALGPPVVALFGPTAPWRTGPFGDGHQIVRLDLTCSPCFRRHCAAPRCLTDLAPEMVQAACEKVLYPQAEN